MSEELIRITSVMTYFDLVVWVLKARQKPGKNSFNAALECLHSDGAEICCVDAKRLHAAKCDTIPEGLYSVLKINKSEILLTKAEDYKFPDYKNLFGDYKTLPVITVSYDEKWGIADAFAKIIRKMALGTLNPDYLSDLLSHEEIFTVYYDSEDPGKVITFTTLLTRALIMPIIDQEEYRQWKEASLKHCDETAY